ncbi:uncharacterized protein LOC143039344 [Oratosquilla oratoria]|uniref:uncharacterized protein LOC143039344 n=1 Tax=Oratosquilla oratoria TaxID=337810 RepID=UPI003F7647B2
MLKFLGTNQNRTTAYHPQANGLVERFHRQLKESLKTQQSSCNWADALPLVLLSIRNTSKVDSDVSPSQLVYAENRLPGEIATPAVGDPDRYALLQLIKETFAPPPPPPPPRTPQSKPVHVPPALAASDYVFVRRDSRRTPLQRPYDGPFKVISRSAKHFLIHRAPCPPGPPSPKQRPRLQHAAAAFSTIQTVLSGDAI